MSRDWTPRELFYVDRERILSGAQSFRKMRIEYHIQDENGVERTFSNDDDPFRVRVKYQFPELCFLGDNKMINFICDNTSNPRVMEVISEYERQLQDLEKRDVEGMFVTPTNDLEKWYDGKLDPSFYYGEYNTELLIEGIREKADEIKDFSDKEEVNDIDEYDIEKE